MDLQNRRDPEVTFIIGAPRSGTTWLAKVFDSHPDIVFRNEPDISLREDRLPVLCRVADIERHRELARDYLCSLIGITTLKASGTLPVFPKSYRRTVPAAGRQGMLVEPRPDPRLRPSGQNPARGRHQVGKRPRPCSALRRGAAEQPVDFHAPPPLRSGGIDTARHAP